MCGEQQGERVAEICEGVRSDKAVSMKTKDELEKLTILAHKAARKLKDAEDEIRNKIARPILRKSVGTCFKYINSYGGNHDRWNLYLKIVSFDEGSMSFTCVQFQRTSLDIVEVKLNQVYNFRGESYFNDTGYIKISKSEYNRAKKSILNTVTRILQ